MNSLQQRRSIRYQRSQSLRNASKTVCIPAARRRFLPQKSQFYTQTEIPTPVATDRGNESEKPDSLPHLHQHDRKDLFHYVSKKSVKDDEPDLGQMSPVKGQFTRTEGKFGQMAPQTPNRGIATDRTPYRSYASLKQTRSLSEIGPNDVEVTYSDIEKQIKPTLHIKPLRQHRRRLTNGSSVSSNAPFGMGELSGRDDRGIRLSRADSGISTPAVLGNIYMNTLGDESGTEEKIYTTIIDGSRMFMEKRHNHRMKPASATAGDMEDMSSLDLQRNSSDDHLTRKYVGKKHQEQKSAFHRTNVEAKKKTVGEQVALVLGVIGAIIATYGVLPVCLYFGAYSYNSEDINIVLNFGILGLLLGVFQVILLYYLVDVQILKKVKEMENKIKNIDPMNYLVVSKCSVFNLIALSIGIHILGGLLLHKANTTVNGTKIVAISLFTIILQGTFWNVVNRLKPPKAAKKKRDILEKELKSISKVRKDLMAELYDTKKKMDMHVSVIEPETKLSNSLPIENSQIPLGIRSSAACAVNVEARKVAHSKTDVAPDFKKMRSGSIKTFVITFLLLIQILIMIEIINLTNVPDNTALSLLCVAFLLVVGSIFGLADLFTPFSVSIIHTMKLVSIIGTAVAFRFQVMGMESRDKMIGAVIINIIYRIILYCFGGTFEEKIIKNAREKRKRSIRIDFYDSLQEREASSLKHPLYLFQKFALVQEVEIFCAVASLLVNIDTKGWLGYIVKNPSLGINDDWFYLYFVIIEILVNVLLTVGFVYVTKRSLSKKALLTNVDLKQEFIGMMMDRKWIILGIKSIVSFLFLFSCFNEL